jgi:hypothetical protein
VRVDRKASSIPNSWSPRLAGLCPGGLCPGERRANTGLCFLASLWSGRPQVGSQAPQRDRKGSCPLPSSQSTCGLPLRPTRAVGWLGCHQEGDENAPVCPAPFPGRERPLFRAAAMGGGNCPALQATCCLNDRHVAVCLPHSGCQSRTSRKRRPLKSKADALASSRQRAGADGSRCTSG